MDLTQLLVPLGVEQLLAELDQQRHLHLSGSPDRLDGLLPWTALNQVLAEHRWEPPRLRLVRDGAPVPVERYHRVRAGAPGLEGRGGGVMARELQAELRAGATLVLDGVDEVHAPLTRFVASMERALGVEAHCNAYASFGTCHGFPTHWDGHHVIVLQLEGRKSWSIFGATRDHPLERDVALPPPPAAPIWEGVLERGDLLCVPRGVWHRAVALAEPSLHLTFGLGLRTGIDFLRWLTDQLRDDALFRRDLPSASGPPARRERLALLREAVLARLDDDALDTYLDSLSANAAPRPRYALPWMATPAPLPADERAQVALTVSRRLRLRPGDGFVSLAALGQTFRFAAAARPLLEAILDGEAHGIGALVATAPALSPGQVRRFLGELLAAGLIAVVDGGDPDTPGRG